MKYRRFTYPKVLDFTPESIQTSKVGLYEIRGVALLRYKRGTARKERILYLWLQEDSWYFSELNEEHIEEYRNAPIKPD